MTWKRIAADLGGYQEPTVNQGFSRGWNLKDENWFDAIRKQLNLFEAQEASGQRHKYSPVDKRSDVRAGNIAGSDPDGATVNYRDRLGATTPLSAILPIRRDMTCK